MNQLKRMCGFTSLALLLSSMQPGLSSSQVWNEDSGTYVNPSRINPVARIIEPPQTDQIELLWNDIHDTDDDDLFSNYSECYDLMVSLGLNPTQISTGSLTSSLLAAYDILVLIDEEIDYSPQEIADIQSWIADGGKLLMIGENCNAFNWISNNQVLEPYNMQFVSTMIPTTGATNFRDHPVTSGLNAISWPYGSMLIISAPAEELAWDNQNQYAITINEAGAVVVIISDSNLMENPYIFNDDNYQCMTNTFNYLASAGGTPDVSIELTYVSGSPVPAGGGNINFDVSIENSSALSQTFDAWIMVQLPNASWYGPVIGPATLTLPANQTISRNRSQNVPAGAPPGTYLYEGYVGVYPDTVLDSSSFTFEKLETGDGASLTEWTNTGDSFDMWLAGTGTETPSEFELFHAYPNPFNPATTISYHLPDATLTRLSVYDMQGCLVATLVDGFRQAGTHEVTFDGSNLASGIYLTRLQAGGFSAVQKMALIK